MLIKVKFLEKYFGVHPKGVLHVGAHEAEELEDYEEYGWLPVYWAEAQPDKYTDLQKRLTPPNHEVFHVAAWDVSGEEMTFNIMSNTQSSSLLELGLHSKEYPEIVVDRTLNVVTQKLDDAIPKDFNPELVALDIQGAELRAIKGFEPRLDYVKWIYCEVNREMLYEGCSTIGEMDEYLGSKLFIRRATRWTINGWGDALYVSKKVAFRQSWNHRIVWNLLQAGYYLRYLIRRFKKVLI